MSGLTYRREPFCENRDGTLSCCGSVNGRLFIVDGETEAVVRAGVAVQMVKTAAAVSHKEIMEKRA